MDSQAEPGYLPEHLVVARGWPVYENARYTPDGRVHFSVQFSPPAELPTTHALRRMAKPRRRLDRRLGCARPGARRASRASARAGPDGDPDLADQHRPSREGAVA
jgi:hypothetical protein